MWRSLGLALALCLLPSGGTESQDQSSFCKQPPAWSIRDQDPMLDSKGSVTVVALLQANYSFYVFLPKYFRLEDLRVKLEKEGYSNISYIVVNHQGISSRLKYPHLKNKVSEHIPVYQQEENQTDVWTLLNGSKDDFLIYDRCGLLVYHLGLPFSFLTFPYVEEAIKIAYCEKKCGNCSLTTLKDEDFCKSVSLATVDGTVEAPQLHHYHEHHHNQGHQHLGSSELPENQQPGAPDAPTHPAPPGLHHHHKHKGQHRQGHPENRDMLGSEGLQHLQKKCINQLLCKLPKDSELAPRKNLPSLCKENITESCHQQLIPTEVSTN
uniref:Selenoprotein P n=1 Tax=Colobus angolensis palliatus TaxID=336983 RepID=A0A2K5IMY6_COLAP